MSLCKRIRTDSPIFDILAEELQKFDSGNHGELYIRELLEQEFGETLIHFTNYKLFGRELDLVAISDKACFLFEVKNIKGKIQLTHFPQQLICTQENGKVDIFQSPISQLAMNHHALQQFFSDHRLSVPIYSAIVFAFHNAHIQTETKEYPILIGREIIHFVRNRHSPSNPVNVQIVNLFEKNATHQAYFPKLAKFNVDLNHLHTGVFCPKCDHLPMQRLPSTWHCPNCQHTSRNAHLAALNDYYDLISNKITNAEGCHYLHLRNRHEAKRLLSAACVAQSGSTRNHSYTIKY